MGPSLRGITVSKKGPKALGMQGKTPVEVRVRERRPIGGKRSGGGCSNTAKIKTRGVRGLSAKDVLGDNHDQEKPKRESKCIKAIGYVRTSTGEC